LAEVFANDGNGIRDIALTRGRAVFEFVRSISRQSEKAPSALDFFRFAAFLVREFAQKLVGLPSWRAKLATGPMTGGSFRAMRGHAHPIPLAEAALAAGLLAWAPSAAYANEAAFCVTCKGPDQTYLCRVTGEDLHRNDGLKLYCVVRPAQEGGHASCAARDEVSGCNGVEKTYSYDGPNIPDGLADDPRVKKLMERVGRDQKDFRKDDKRKSLVEVTGQAMSASRRGIRNVRASLGGREAETNQSALPSSSPPIDPLPELKSQTPAPLPLSAAPAPGAQSAALPPESVTAPPARTSRVRRGAQNVGHFARSSYRCLRSLFRECGSESAEQGPN
jgi:hypothetical protein